MDSFGMIVVYTVLTLSLRNDDASMLDIKCFGVYIVVVVSA